MDQSAVLVAEQADGVVRLVDSELSTWVLEAVPLDYEPSPRGSMTSGMAAALAASLADEFPRFKDLLASGQGFVVRFSPEVERGLRDGTYKLLQTGSSAKAVARSTASGQVVEAGVVVGGAAAAGGVGWPVLLAGAVAVAAAAAHQRWLEQVFASLEDGLEQIAVRLRDDDHGDLGAAEQLIELIGDSAVGSGLSPLRVAELAEARRNVESIYFSRRRFAARFKDQIEERQVKAGMTKAGTPKTWTADIARDLVDEDKGVIDELVLFFRAMIARARLGAIAASILIADGSYDVALRLLDQTRSTMRTDYFDLHN
jgi:hypothetical protein